MTENITRRYHLRLTERFAFYDITSSQMFHDFAVGAEITDQSMIEWLQSLNAPVEKIFEGEFRR